MNNKRAGKMNTAFGLINMKRCLFGALVSIAAFPVMLLLSLVKPESVEAYRISVTFFSIASAAFAYLFYQMIGHRARKYYEAVTWTYLVFFHLFISFFAQRNILFYYAAVIVMAYLVYLPLGKYAVMVLGELSCFAVIVNTHEMEALDVTGLVVLAAVHLFAFIFSRDIYGMKKNCMEEEKKLRREMQEAERDPLTGLVNRRGLERHVAENWKNCVNRREMVAVFVMDIDLFKSYNDRFGHVEGDECIRRVAHSIAETVGKNGIAARIGGEEFLVFIRDREVQEVYRLAEQIREDVERMQISRGTGNNAVITISIGIDMRYATADLTLQGLYGRADRQLYQAKQNGRNCVRGSGMTGERRYRIG